MTILNLNGYFLHIYLDRGAIFAEREDFFIFFGARRFLFETKIFFVEDFFYFWTRRKTRKLEISIWNLLRKGSRMNLRWYKWGFSGSGLCPWWFFFFLGGGKRFKKTKELGKMVQMPTAFRDSSVWYNYGVISSLSTYLSQKLIAWAHSHWKRLMRIYLVCCKSLQRGCTVTGRDWCVFNSNTGCTVTGRDWCVLNSNTGCTVTGRDWCVLL